MKTKKNRQRPLTLEEVFNQEVTKAPATFSRRSAIILTPLSEESVRKHGINPDILRKRDLGSFFEPQMDARIQKMRYDAYSKRRDELMKIACKEKQNLRNMEAISLVEQANNEKNGSLLTPAEMLEQQARKNQQMLAAEERRLEKVKSRQQKELLSVLNFQSRMVRAQNELSDKAEKEARMQENAVKVKERAERQKAEEKRLQEIRRRAQEDAAEHMRRIEANARFEKEKKIVEQKKQYEREQKRRTRLREEERVAKIEAIRIQTECELQNKQKDIRRRIEAREAKEKDHQKKMEIKRRKEQEYQAEKRRAAHNQIEKNREKVKRLEEKRKSDLTKKQMEHECYQQIKKAEKESRRGSKEHRAMILEMKRKSQLKATREREEKVKELLRQKFEHEEAHLKREAMERAKESVLQREMLAVKKELKRENVERIKMKQEYKRIETLRKVIENDRRTEEMLQVKEELSAQRRTAAIEARRQKDKMISLLEQSKRSGCQSIKKILTVLSPTGPHSSIHDIEKLQRRKSQSSLRSNSASIIKGPPVDLSLYERLSQSAGGAPQKYISPYLGDAMRGPTI